jgi:RluA family pseudouridine synthase
MTTNSHNKPKPFRPPSKRHQPKGLSILYEDRDILVVNKACGILTVSNEKVREKTAYYLLTDYIRKGNSKSRNRLFIVHRLDRETSGVIVFAKTEEAKRYLQDNWQEFQKTYYALVEGTPPQQEGIITSYLVENEVHKMYSVKDPTRGKLAKTGYKVVKQAHGCSLLEINLLTGRKNQIRVHLSENGCPVVGDRKYGNKRVGSKRLALHAESLTIRHPHSHEPMTFTADVPFYFASLMKTSRVESGR